MTQQNISELSYEKAFEKLETILEKMNQPGLSLEDSITLFEQADQLVQYCSKKIEQAEKRIDVILKNRQDGSVQLSPFETMKTS